MYPQRTPPESGMEKSERRNLIPSQCLACYVNLPTSPRLSCTRLLSFLKVTELAKKSTFNHTFQVLHTLTYLIIDAGCLNPPLYTVAQGGLVKRTHQVPHIITNHPPLSSLRTLDKM